MKNRIARAALFAGISLAGSGSIGFTQTADQPAAPPVNAAPAPYAMTMGDMMNTLIQPRHAKLAFAGHAQNWPLALYALAELRESFAGIAKARPKFRGFPVGALVEAAVSQPMAALETAIRAKDLPKFIAAYDQLTQGCNACHMELNHPFVVIKPPAASAFPNQEFNTPQQ
jgi:hypothetical protein